jgi:hypothetical protein
MTSRSDRIAGRRSSRYREIWAVALLALLAGLAPQVSDARSSSAQLQVSARVLPRCQEWRASTEGFRTDAAHSCAPGSATLLRQGDELSVRCAPGTCPQMIRQADPATGNGYMVLVF